MCCSAWARRPAAVGWARLRSCTNVSTSVKLGANGEFVGRLVRPERLCYACKGLVVGYKEVVICKQETLHYCVRLCGNTYANVTICDYFC